MIVASSNVRVHNQTYAMHSTRRPPQAVGSDRPILFEWNVMPRGVCGLAGRQASSSSHHFVTRFAANFCLAEVAVTFAKHCRRLAQRLAPEGCVAEAGPLPKESHTCSIACWSNQPCKTPCLTAQQSAPVSLLPTLWCPHSWWKTKRRTASDSLSSRYGLKTTIPGAAEPRLGKLGSSTLRARPQRRARPAINSSPLRRKSTGDDNRAKSTSRLASFRVRFKSTEERGSRLSKPTNTLSATTTPKIARPRCMIRLQQIRLANLRIGHKCGTPPFSWIRATVKSAIPPGPHRVPRGRSFLPGVFGIRLAPEP